MAQDPPTRTPGSPAAAPGDPAAHANADSALVRLDDHQLAAHIATQAGQLLMALRRDSGLSGQALGAAGDAQANQLILRLLRAARPQDAFLSEETAPDPARLQQHRVWIIDPLDGTREYAEAAADGALRSDWAVHVALAEGGRPSACAVALPADGITLCTLPAPVLPPMADAPLRIVVSRSRPPAEAQHLADTLGAELVPLGSAGAKVMAVVRGQVQAYVHSGGQYEWDSCAPVGVALSAGLHASRLDGSPLVYNRADTYLPDLLVCRMEWAPRLLAALAKHHG